jgi:hypothetical protein
MTSADGVFSGKYGPKAGRTAPQHSTIAAISDSHGVVRCGIAAGIKRGDEVRLVRIPAIGGMAMAVRTIDLATGLRSQILQ